jgi:hypothetical protein
VTSPGSDCPTGKAQYATKQYAINAAIALKRNRNRGCTANAYRCAWCALFHVGNKGGDTSKGRRRR